MATAFTSTVSSPAPASHRAARLIRRQRLREYFAFDAWMYQRTIALAGVAGGMAALAAGRGREAMKLLSKVHRAAYSPAADRIVEATLRRAWGGSRFGRPLLESCTPENVELYVDGPARKFVEDPAALLGPLVMVLRSPGPGYKGVLLLQYNYVFPFFRRFFDVERIAERYHLVLEPSWSGYCNPEVLCYAGMRSPVFVQAYEPRDRTFIDSLGAGFVTIPTSTNWWVDHRIFRPLPDVRKNADIVMVAGWGDYKRHARFFEAIRPLRDRKPDLRIILVGYGLGMSADDIQSMAAHFGLADAIEVHENLTQEQVNVQFNRARVNIIWSRKEGVNRAIIEGMFANVPCLLREGFNYGHRYEYVNEATGAFATEDTMADRVEALLRRCDNMAPRDWVMRHMSCDVSTDIVAATIATHGTDAGVDAPLAVKTNGLHGMHYWSSAAERSFRADYDFLKAARRNVPTHE